MIIRFLNWILKFRGYMVVQLREYSQALTTIKELNESVQKSGFLCELIRRKPKVVRRIDQLTAIAETNLRNSLTNI